MNRFSAIVVDDEKKARDGLSMLLSKDPEIDLVAVCKNGMEAITQINSLKPQLLLLDIQMPEINGFEVLSSIDPDKMLAIVFTTAYDQYALKAFEIHAIDYLLKPFTDERFFEALAHAKHHILHASLQQIHLNLNSLLKGYQTEQAAPENDRLISAESRQTAPFLERLVIKSSGKVYFLRFDEIIWIEACDYFVKIHTSDKTHMVRESLKTMENRLPESSFLRIHRSHMINSQMIRTLEPFFNGDFFITLSNGKTLKGSRNYKHRLEAFM